MSSASRFAAIVLVLAAAAAGLVVLASVGSGEPAPPSVAPAAPPTDPSEATVPVPAARSAPQADPAKGERLAVEDAPSDPSSCPQGAQGRVLDPHGMPVVDAPVFLVAGPEQDLFRQMMLMQQGMGAPPLARARTDADGRFALPLLSPDAQRRYEIRVISDRWVDRTIPGISIAPGQWWDAGVIRLETGAVVHGRVTAVDGGLPVPGARVMIEPQTLGGTLAWVPGRENGLVAEADRSGAFRFENVAPGAVRIAAVAAGYARQDKHGVVVDPAGPTEVDFALAQGMAIAGVVTDAAGTPVGDAAVEAHSMTARTPVRNSTRAAADGSFEVIGLTDGPYMLTAVAPGHVAAQVKPIAAGTTDVRLVLESQGSVRVRALGKDGRALARYTITVKRHFADSAHFGNTTIPPEQARPDAEHVHTLRGLDPGSYVLQIDAEGHAKAFSKPVAVDGAQPPPLVEVRLDEGGILEGTVVDSRGQPLPGVEVHTLPNEFQENPLVGPFASFIPIAITNATAKSDARGRFRLAMLTPGIYQLKLSHRDHFDLYVKDSAVEAGRTTTLAPIELQPGTEVTGTVRVDGAPASQVKVTLATASDPQQPANSVFTANAVTDNEGRFRIDRRVPPGIYQIMAARQTLPNPLQQIVDFNQTKQQITLARGQDRYQLSIAIASQ